MISWLATEATTFCPVERITISSSVTIRRQGYLVVPGDDILDGGAGDDLLAAGDGGILSPEGLGSTHVWR